MKGQKTEYATVYRVIDICNEILSWILMVILVCLFCYGTYGIGDSYVLEQDAMPQHDEVYRPTEEDSLSFEELQAKNSDVCGWITIYGTHVDYPVVRGADNSVYLMRDPEGNYRMSGSIFMDCVNQREFTDFNTILYGHHMKSGQMFGSLSSYSDQSYCEKHPYIQFDTIYEKGLYEIMYVFRSRVYSEDEIVFKYYQFIDAQSEQEFDSYMNDMAEMSLYDTGVTASFGDQLLTLSTCDYQEKNGRFVVVAKKVTTKE